MNWHSVLRFAASLLAIYVPPTATYELSTSVCDDIFRINGPDKFCSLPIIHTKCPSLYDGKCGSSGQKDGSQDTGDGSGTNGGGQDQSSGSLCASLLSQLEPSEFCGRPTMHTRCPEEFASNCDSQYKEDTKLRNDQNTDNDSDNGHKSNTGRDGGTDGNSNGKSGKSKISGEKSEKTKSGENSGKSNKSGQKSDKTKSGEKSDKTKSGEKSEKSEKSKKTKSSEKSSEKFTDKEDQIKQCCEAQGVRSSCMDVCTYDLSDVNIGCKTECADDLKKWMYCASNQQDNSDCCEKNDNLGDRANKHCLEFCKGKVPSLKSLFGTAAKMLKYKPCINEFDYILKCHEDNSPDEDKTSEKRWKDEGDIPDDSKQLLEAVSKC